VYFDRKIAALLFTFLLSACSSQQPAAVFSNLNHLERVWQSENGQLFSALQNGQGELAIHNPETGEFYAYARKDGRIQRTPSHAPVVGFAQGQLLLGDLMLTPAEVSSQEIWFRHDGINFYGILTVPRSDHPVPLIINAHGSGNAPATRFDWAASWYTTPGYATFIFDKRGTGRSGGSYTHNFEVLAGDLQAAVSVLTQHPAIDSTFIGVAGYSQGVYVSTLAASQDKRIRFLIASYGMTESPLTEEMQITRSLFEASYPQLDWQAFEPFAMACAEAFALKHNDKWNEVGKYRRKWRDQIAAEDMQTTLVGDGCLPWPGFVLRLVGRSQLPPGLIWDYDPKPAMAGLNIPVIWQFGEADTTAPSATSIRNVKTWIAAGKPFQLLSYADAEHGIYLTGSNEHGDEYRYKDPQYIGDLINWLNRIKRAKQ